MEVSLTFQYILIGAVVLAASYSLFRIIRRGFTSKKGKKHAEFGCNNECGS
ncbi:hypothetical protein [Kaistella palustris]|uniref:hypothetical protein n=1 Tax=Kaistella palustris TaxID=493376 RepID=UPI0004258F8B|nr:hypothetical protein [Kaistella palustris]